jgi:adenine phosphoribosyltransferase
MKHPAYLQRINTHTSGRNDITPLFADYDSFVALVRDLAEPFRSANIDLVAGIDAFGFILGATLALELHKGFLAVRKGGKLPVPSDSVEFVDASRERKTLELRKDALRPGTRVLVVDEWIKTGAQVGATAALIEKQGGVVAGIASIHMDDNERTRPLRSQYVCHWVWRDVDHHG